MTQEIDFHESEIQFNWLLNSVYFHSTQITFADRKFPGLEKYEPTHTYHSKWAHFEPTKSFKCRYCNLKTWKINFDKHASWTFFFFSLSLALSVVDCNQKYKKKSFYGKCGSIRDKLQATSTSQWNYFVNTFSPIHTHTHELSPYFSMFQWLSRLSCLWLYDFFSHDLG